MKIQAKWMYWPLFALYGLGPFTHDVVPYLSKITLSSMSYFALFYLVGFIAVVPALLIVKKIENGKLVVTTSIAFRMIAGVSIFAIPYLGFWSDWSAFYISIIVSFYASFICLIAFRKDLIKRKPLLKDSATGKFYKVKGGKAYLLSEREAGDIYLGKTGGSITVMEFSSSAIVGFDSQSSVFSLNNSTNNFGFDNHTTGITVNPSSGMPMIGGISGVDIQGNSWGTNFNDPTNHQSYDPTRGF